MSYTQMQTRWEANEDGDLIHVGYGDPAWRTITESGSKWKVRALKYLPVTTPRKESI